MGIFDRTDLGRRTMRLSNWDYAQQAFYFVTICAYERLCLFGEVREGKMVLNEAGEMVVRELVYSCQLRPIFLLDSYIVMPNHIHGILLFDKPEITGWETNKFGRQSRNLGAVIRAFKSTVKRYANDHKIDFAWQPLFHDDIIYNETELNNIRHYILQNPCKWLKKYSK